MQQYPTAGGNLVFATGRFPLPDRAVLAGQLQPGWVQRSLDQPQFDMSYKMSYVLDVGMEAATNLNDAAECREREETDLELF